MDSDVIIRKEGRAGRITLNRPKALHALNTSMCEQITGALLGWLDDECIEFVLVDHLEGSRGFCAGGDIAMLAQSGKSDGQKAREFFQVEYRLNDLIYRYPKPYIAIIDGVTMGGGVGISVHGKYQIATERTVFAMPETGIGLFPDVGGTWFLPRLKGELGTWLALTGARLKSWDALAAGIATHYVHARDLPSLKTELCADGLSVLDTLESHAEGSFAPYLTRLNGCFGAGSVEAICEALERAGDDWCDTQLERIQRASPTSLKVALSQMKVGRDMHSFADVMKMEYRIASRMVARDDFQEGVRASLIDRHDSPKWHPSTLQSVLSADIDCIFSSIPGDELKMVWED